MHAPRTKRSLRMLYLTALLSWVRLPFVALAVWLVARAVVRRSPELLTPAGQAVAALFALCFLHWWISRKARCPLCATPVMGGAKCVRHRRAGTLLGSHTLLVAKGILLQGQFTCPYCNERTAMIGQEQARKLSGQRKRRRRGSLGSPENELWRDL